MLVSLCCELLEYKVNKLVHTLGGTGTYPDGFFETSGNVVHNVLTNEPQ